MGRVYRRGAGIGKQWQFGLGRTNRERQAACFAASIAGAFSGKVDTGFPQENATTKGL
jgi:hypothetical protein